MRSWRRGWAIAILAVLCVLTAAPAVLAGQKSGRAKARRHRISRHVTRTTDGLVEFETDAERDVYPDGSTGTQLTTSGRLRLADGLQLNVQVPVLSAEGGGMALGDVAAGVNVQWLEHVPLLGDVFVSPSLKLPTGTLASATGTGTTDAGVLMIGRNQLGPIGLDLSVGYSRRSGDGTNAPKHATSWSAALDGPARGPVGWSMEWSGLPRTSGPSGSASAVVLAVGPTFAVRDWLEIDAAVMAPLVGDQPKALFVSAVYRSPKIRSAASPAP